MRLNASQPPAVFRQRRKNLGALFEKHKLDAYFFNGEADLFYLTGFMSEGYYGIVNAAGNIWLFASALLAGQIRENTSGCHVVMGSLTKGVRALQARHKWKHVGFDTDQILHRVGVLLVKEGMRPRPNPLPELRIVKEKDELEAIRRACHVTATSIDYIRTKLKRGVTEKQLAVELESYFYRQGAQRIAFDLIVAMGPNTALPHHVPGQTRLAANQPIIFDIGCTVGGYRSDLTRTLFYGKMNSPFKRVFSVVQAAQKAGIERVRPGSTGGQVDAAARGCISQAGYARYFIHSTGHGVGIDIHEPPWIRPKSPDELKPGMVLTVEPGIYLPGRFGVRIEDTLRVTEQGYEILTK